MTFSTQSPNLPDYEQLVKFLFQPFLSAPDAIGVDCEYTVDRHRIWIRVAVADVDRDTAFGRGGRNIQAIRTVIQAAATAVGQSIYFDVYGYTATRKSDSADHGEAPREQKSSGIRPTRRSAGGEENSDEKPSPRSNVPPPRPRK